jgi:DNA-binding Xre family transcriptional regulator
MVVRLKIEELRIQKGLTQEQLAHRLGRSLKGYQHLIYKATSIEIDLIDLLCEQLTCEPGDLFERAKSNNDVEEQNRLIREKRRQQKSERMKQWWADKRKQQSKKGKENGA